jgi:protoheme IX farnesyltransferase
MNKQQSKHREVKQSQLQWLLLSAAITAFLAIVMGGIVRVTGSEGACQNWPSCSGSLAFPSEQAAKLDYTHRVLIFTSVPLLLGSLVSAWRQTRKQNLLLLPLTLASGFAIIQIAIDVWLVRSPALLSQTAITAIQSGLALFTLAGILTAVVMTFYQMFGTESTSLNYRSSFARLSLISLGVVFILLVSGGIITSSNINAACEGWPVCAGTPNSWQPAAWLHISHRLLVAITGLLMGFLLFKAWKTQRTQTPILVATTAAAVLFFSQALLGSQMVAGYPPYLLGLHQATAAGVWAAMIVQVVSVGMAARSQAEEIEEATATHNRKALVKDLLALTKPIVVALLLVTTYAGMVIGAQEFPTLAVTFWTLLGGFMAAGGSGAINQYIDHDDDRKMQRTQKRPIPSGRLTPGEGLAFGTALALTSFYIMVAFVNLLAAMLTLVGIIYYVLLYSIFLKKTTVQNIVIGGGAGAIPPLVGWAAATGSLNIPSLFLFAIIFMWTPPHFWALALVRRKDYARAGVPMMPVVRGEKETRWQILIYTIQLVLLTLLLPLFGLGSAVYLVGAVVLGIWLLLAAWKVWKQGGNKLAFKMYRYSSMYLAFLFIVLMVDRLL